MARRALARDPFHGRWRITWMSAWDQDFVDMEVTGHFTFAAGRLGEFQFGLVQGEMDCRPRAGSQPPQVEFTWRGAEEGHEMCGSGRAEIIDGELRGYFCMHMGDDSAFHAVRSRAAARPRGKR